MADETVNTDFDETLTDQEEHDVENNQQVEDEDSVAEEVVDESSETNDIQNEWIKKNEQLEAELAETKTRLLRVQADYDNFRKRTKSERDAAAKYRAQSLVEELLPAVDNFERALATETKSEEATSILTGVEMVYRQLQEALEKEGVTEIEADGEVFDPNKHQAVMQEHSDEHDSGIVLAVMQKGYQLKDRVIRPAMVKVSE